MTVIKGFLALLLSVLALTLSAGGEAHSLKDVEKALGDREKYFQPVDRTAPGFLLRNAEGEVVKLSDLRGKVVVLHFIYAHCPDVCPLHAEKIAEIQDMVNRTPMKDQVRFISVTTDPARDTPEVLRAYGPAHGLAPVNWTFLTTRPDQAEDETRRLAEAYGHKFTRTEDGYQAHSVVTHVIDKEGHWRANFHGLKFAPVNLVVFLNALANDHHHPPESESERGFWSRLRELF